MSENESKKKEKILVNARHSAKSPFISVLNSDNGTTKEVDMLESRLNDPRTQDFGQFRFKETDFAIALKFVEVLIYAGYSVTIKIIEPNENCKDKQLLLSFRFDLFD